MQSTKCIFLLPSFSSARSTQRAYDCCSWQALTCVHPLSSYGSNPGWFFNKKRIICNHPEGAFFFVFFRRDQEFPFSMEFSSSFSFGEAWFASWIIGPEAKSCFPGVGPNSGMTKTSFNGLMWCHCAHIWMHMSMSETPIFNIFSNSTHFPIAHSSRLRRLLMLSLCHLGGQGVHHKNNCVPEGNHKDKNYPQRK